MSPEEIIQLLHLTPLTEEGGMVAEKAKEGQTSNTAEGGEERGGSSDNEKRRGGA